MKCCLLACLLALAACAAPDAAAPSAATPPPPTADVAGQLRATIGALETERIAGAQTIATLQAGLAAATQTAAIPTLTPAVPPPPTPIISGALARRLDDYLAGQTDAARFAGVVLVARGPETLLLRGYGLASQEQRVPNSAQTSFRLGSLTKQFTAAAILHLRDEGNLAVSDPICRFLAPCPEQWQPITIDNLLHHSGGIPNFTAQPDFPRREPFAVTPDDLVSRLAQLPVDFAPGERFQYSNGGYVLLAQIVAVAADMPYPAYLRATFFQPAGMDATFSAPETAIVPYAATGYTTLPQRATPIDLSNLYGAGDLISTAPDLLKWERLLAGDVLSPASKAELYAPQQGDYADGWRISTEYGKKIAWHAGKVSGFSSYVGHYLEDDVTIIVLANVYRAPSRAMGLDIAALLFGAQLPSGGTPIDPTATPAP